MIIGQKIKVALNEKGIKQVELAEELGMRRQHITALLKAKDIKFSVLLRISQFLEIPIEYFSGTEISNDFPLQSSTYKKQKFIEERIEDLEKRMDQVEKGKNT